MLDLVSDAAAGFSTSATLTTLRGACAHAGLSDQGAALLRFGENAIYQVADVPVVVRIARSADRLRRVERELCFARWLAAEDLPAVRVWEETAYSCDGGGAGRRRRHRADVPERAAPDRDRPRPGQ